MVCLWSRQVWCSGFMRLFFPVTSSRVSVCFAVLSRGERVWHLSALYISDHLGGSLNTLKNRVDSGEAAMPSELLSIQPGELKFPCRLWCPLHHQCTFCVLYLVYGLCCSSQIPRTEEFLYEMHNAAYILMSINGTHINCAQMHVSIKQCLGLGLFEMSLFRIIFVCSTFSFFFQYVQWFYQLFTEWCRMKLVA